MGFSPMLQMTGGNGVESSGEAEPIPVLRNVVEAGPGSVAF